MKQKKKGNIILISIILLVILIIAILVVAYFFTDMFKSNKQLFFKYGAQITNAQTGFVENDLEQYFKKKQEMSYEDNGTITANIESDISENRLKNVNNFDITFSGKVDTPNSKSEQKVSLNYSKDNSFPINYRQVGNTIGLQTDYIGTKYIAVEVDKINALQNKLNSAQINTQETTDVSQETTTEITTNGTTMQMDYASQIEDVTNMFNNITITEEDVQYLKDKYLEVLNSQLQDSDFSKVQDANLAGYKLTLTGEKIKQIAIKIIDTLSVDEQGIEILNKYMKNFNTSITSSVLEDLKEEINNTSIDNQQFEITFFQKDGNITKIQFEVLNQFKFIINKSSENNALKYALECYMYENEKETSKIYLNAEYKGLTDLTEVSENYELGMENLEEENQKYSYIYNSNAKFLNNIKIEDFSNQNSMVLNNYEGSAVNNFLNQVTERITLVNEQQMQELGVSKNENPIIDLLPMSALSTNSMKTEVTAINELEITTFNEKFTLYESTNSKGVTVKGLLSVIQANNESQTSENRKIREINFDGTEYEVNEQNITLVKSSIETESSYKVEFEKDSTGVIFRVVINKKE